MSLAATLAALVILLLVGLPLYTAGKYEETPSVAGDEDDDDTSDARSPEFRAIRCLCVCAALLTVSVMLFPVFRESLGSENILDYVLKGNWENGLNVFALTAALISICKTGVVIFLFRRLMRLLADRDALKHGQVRQAGEGRELQSRPRLDQPLCGGHFHRDAVRADLAFHIKRRASEGEMSFL